MSRDLRISSELSLPAAAAVTQRMGILARTGAGKTYTAKVLVEELVKAKLPVVVLDPQGVFWGLRVAADGKRAGLPITILGGEHGDVPLEPTAGKVVADLVVEHPGFFILDLSLFDSDEQQDRFAYEFAARLFRAKATDRKPLHVVVDEADSFMPQQPFPNQKHMLGAWTALVRKARVRGVGLTLISQRAASLNKNVLTQIEVLIAMQTTGPHDRKAIEEWVKGHGTTEERELVMGSLASLKRGTGWVWSPQWLGLLKRVRFRTAETFDSSKTPEPGDSLVEPKKLAAVDLTALHERMRATIEKVKAQDPKLLKQRISELEAQLQKRPMDEVERLVEKRVEVPILKDAQIGRLEKSIDRLHAAGNRLEEASGHVKDAAQLLAEALQSAKGNGRGQAVAASTKSIALVARVQQTRKEPATARRLTAPAGDLSAYALHLLDTVAARHPMRLTRSQIALLAGRSTKSSAFDTAMARLGTYIEKDGSGLYGLTEAGIAAAAVSPTQPQDPDEVIAHWRRVLPKYELSLFDVLMAAYPAALSREELAQRAGRSLTSSAFDTAIGRLLANKLAEAPEKGLVRASETLFPEGAAA